MRERGFVVWFSFKGWGFIKPHSGGPDIFVHVDAVEPRADGQRDLFQDEVVSFERGLDRRQRPCALRVRVEQDATA